MEAPERRSLSERSGRPARTFDKVVAGISASWIVVVAIALIPAMFVIALAFTFPLFLGFRELGSCAPGPRPVTRDAVRRRAR